MLHNENDIWHNESSVERYLSSFVLPPLDDWDIGSFG